MSVIIETHDLVRKFKDVIALNGVNLQIKEGENYGLFGPNGSGKTTLIRIIASLLKPTSGEARVLGEKVPSRKICSQIGYMTQTESLYYDLTVRENLNFFATIYGMTDKKERKKRIDETIELVELTDKRDSLFRNLSGGLRQRTSLAVALVHQPNLLLLDEPTVGIDPKLRLFFWEHFNHLAKEGHTIIVSSHHLDEAEKCMRLGFMREGKIIAQGSARELKKQTSSSNLEEAFIKFCEIGD